MLSAPSQVLVRNKDYFNEGKWLLTNPTDAEIFAQLANPQIVGFHQFYDVFQTCLSQAKQNQHVFSHQAPLDDGPYDGAVIYMPKAKEHARMLIANLAACVKPNGLIFLVGENKSGIKGADKLFSQVSNQVNKLDSARHCSLYCATIADAAAEFKFSDWHQSISFTMAEKSVQLTTVPGVFSANELDAGTRLLLENLPDNISGKVLDFASGNGVIGCWIASQNANTEVTMSDVSALAIYCSKLNAQQWGAKVEVLPSNGLKELTEQYKLIVTNPPFHTGIKTDYSIAAEFIQQVRRFMLPSGRLVLVANRFLPYPDMLDKYVGKARVIAQTSKFNLYSCG